MRLIKIKSKLFPDRYLKFTNFQASYRYLILDQNKVKLYLDPRYLSAAINKKSLDKKYEAYPINEMPLENLIIDPWEFSISEFLRLNLKNPILKDFESYEKSDHDNGFQMKTNYKEAIYNESIDNLDYDYFLSNFYNITGPCLPYVFKNKEVVQSDCINQVFFDPDITPLYFLKDLNLQNTVDDVFKINASVLKDISGYKKFSEKESLAWVNLWFNLFYNIDNIRLWSESSIASWFLNVRKTIHNNFALTEAFDPIIGKNQNSSFIHYSPSSEENVEADFLLCDIGSNIANNGPGFISDITRFFYLGALDRNVFTEIQEAYTNVLKAHINVAFSSLQPNQPVSKLASIADEFVNFPHALGHGIGSDVIHAYPVISKYSKSFLKPHMLITNEPGFYKKNEFGIRLESEMISMLDGENLYFEYVGFVPFDKKLIIYEKLTKKELQWLDDFHDKCFNFLKDHFDLNFLNKILK